MTISRKLNKSVTTTLITLLMLSAFVGLISFANAAEVNSPSTTSFSATGAGTALWSTTQANDGDFSAQLVTSGTDTAEVKLPTNFLFGQPDQDLSDPEVFYFEGFVVTSGGSLTQRLYMDSNNDGKSDYYFSSTLTVTTTGSWVDYAVGDGNWVVKNSTFGSTQVHGIPNNTADDYISWNMTAGFAEDKVVAVSVYVTGALNVFVDCINIGETEWNLEPAAMTLCPALADVQPASAKAPVGSTINVLAAAGTFDEAEPVYTYFQGVGDRVDTTISTELGGLSADFVVPNLPAGTYTVTSVGLTSGNAFTGQFTISAPEIEFDKERASAGSEIDIIGSDFKVNANNINVTFNGQPWATMVESDEEGAFEIDVILPNVAPGTYPVTATDGVNTATEEYTIPTVAITKVDPSSGPAGRNVILTAEGFTRNGLVQIYVNGALYRSGPADEYGGFTGSTIETVTIPNVAPGTVTIIAIDYTTGISSNTATYTVRAPTIAAGLRTNDFNTAIKNGPVGATVWVNGTNFRPGATINITLGVNGPQIVESLPTAGTSGFNVGKLSTTLCTIPDVAPGEYVIAATDGTNTATTPFTVNAPSITLTPAAGPVATVFTVEGRNFKVSTEVDIYWINGTTNTIELIDATTNVNGSFSVDTAVPAGLAIGQYIVNATDEVNYATATFNVGAAITAITPDEGPVGSRVNVQGKGFTNNEDVNIYFGDILVAEDVDASSTGSINVNITVPDVLAGEYEITAFDEETELTTPGVTFEVEEPEIMLVPIDINNYIMGELLWDLGSETVVGQVGQLTFVIGGDFKIDSTVSIYFNGVLVATAEADEFGMLENEDLENAASFTVPSVVPGSYLVVATDGVNNATATFNVYGTGGVGEVLSIVTEIKETLAEYGTFYNFTNNWFMTIDNKLGNFTGNDTVASLLYSIKADVSGPQVVKFDFGGPQTAYQPEYIHITHTTAFDDNGRWGWTDATGMQYRTRAIVNPASPSLNSFVTGTMDRTFQVALPNGDYTVIVTQADTEYAHDGMTIIANGELIETVNTLAGGAKSSSITVTVEDGLLQVTFGKADGASDGSWVVNDLVIQKAYAATFVD